MIAGRRDDVFFFDQVKYEEVGNQSDVNPELLSFV